MIENNEIIQAATGLLVMKHYLITHAREDELRALYLHESSSLQVQTMHVLSRKLGQSGIVIFKPRPMNVGGPSDGATEQVSSLVGQNGKSSGS